MKLRNTSLFASLILVYILIFSSCLSYTYEDAKDSIPIGITEQKEPPLETKRAPTQAEPILSLPIPLITTLIPLPAERVLSEKEVQEIGQFIDEQNIHIIGITGSPENLTAVLSTLKKPLALSHERKAIITSLPIVEVYDHVLLLQIEHKVLYAGILELQEETILPLVLHQDSTWIDSIQKLHQKRLLSLSFIASLSPEIPLVLFSSLGEPSAQDWEESMEEHNYRCSIQWPMVTHLEENSFIDSYRATHYTVTHEKDSTWRYHTPSYHFQERTDFLFVRKLIPLETKVYTFGENQLLLQESRSSIAGTFFIL